MRVLAVTSTPPWAVPDGDALILAHHLAALSARHELTLLCATRRGQIGAAPEGVETEAYTMRVPAGLDYLARRLEGLLSGEPAHVHWVERRALRLAFAQHLQRDRPDLVYLFGWGTAQLWRWAPRLPAVHFAIDPWAPTVQNRRLPTWRRVADVGTERAIAAHEARHYPKLSAVVFVTREDAEAVAQAIPGTHVRAVPNGVLSGPEPPEPPAEPVLGFHGGFGVESNVVAARVFANEVVGVVRARVPGARALIIGRDPPPEVLALAREGVEVTGEVAAVRPWLVRCAVYVAPMTTGAGIKNKVLEAMAAGRPVVATRLGLQGIGAGGGVFEAPDAAGIAEIVISLLGDDAARTEAGRAARRRAVDEFSWERSAARLEAVWEESLARQACSPGREAR